MLDAFKHLNSKSWAAAIQLINEEDQSLLFPGRLKLIDRLLYFDPKLFKCLLLLLKSVNQITSRVTRCVGRDLFKIVFDI